MEMKPSMRHRQASVQSGVFGLANDTAAVSLKSSRVPKARSVTNAARSASGSRPFNGRAAEPLTQALATMAPASASAKKAAVGFLLTDLAFKPVYTNDAAVAILSLPGGPDPSAALSSFAQRIRSVLHAERFTSGLEVGHFLSGKRLYICRPFLLDRREARTRASMVVVLLERQPREAIPLSELSRQFHLSPRECETVQYLSHGLTTKEVAQRMNVSPNTVKQFVRLIMSKMGVTTRSGVVGKLVAV